MAPTTISRTVQYWRLVDGQDHSVVSDFDWCSFFEERVTKRYQQQIDNRGHAGTIRVITGSAWSDFESRFSTEDSNESDDESRTYGVVIAAEKDFIPNQEESNSGNQAPMSLKGETWEPVDNLYVWHLPFGNLIGVLAESVSSSRASKYASWLSRYMRSEEAFPEGKGNDFQWAAIPVIDEDRAKKLKNVTGLKSAVFTGIIGAGEPQNNLLSVFTGPRNPPNSIRLEVKASLVKGRSDDSDAAEILQWFKDAFGPLDGTPASNIKKAQVTTDPEDGESPTEVDLINHRLTRKRKIPLADETTRSITADVAFDAIIGAANLDAKDLYRLRGPVGSTTAVDGTT